DGLRARRLHRARPDPALRWGRPERPALPPGGAAPDRGVDAGRAPRSAQGAGRGDPAHSRGEPVGAARPVARPQGRALAPARGGRPGGMKPLHLHGRTTRWTDATPLNEPGREDPYATRGRNRRTPDSDHGADDPAHRGSLLVSYPYGGHGDPPHRGS